MATSRSVGSALSAYRGGLRRRETVRIVQALRRVVKALEIYSQEVRRAFGVTGPQLWALKTLERDGRITAGQLASALAVHQSSGSILVSRLEKEGLVRRVRAAGDRRRVYVALTSRGAALARRAPEAAQGRLLHGLSEMPLHRVRAIRRAVDAIVRAMEASDVKAPFFFSD